MARSEAKDSATGNPVEDPKTNAEQNAKAPLHDRPVAHPDHPVAGENRDAPGQTPPASTTASAPREEEGSAPAHVRVAGRKEMDMPPKQWSKMDEEGDESFPASDPPGNY